MKIKVLGSSAGGGFPQWNCNCRNCDGVRRGTLNARRRTQSSIAVSANGEDWLLVNASPDLLAQIAANPELQPARRTRDTGIAAALVIDAQIDHVTGLLMLRERDTPLPLYATDAVWDDLSTGFPVAPILSHYCGVEHRRIALDGAPLSLAELPGVQIDALPLSSKAPPYSPHRHAPARGDNLGLTITNPRSGRRAFYAPGLGAIEPHVLDAMREADLLLVDGTLWTGDEMIRLGLSNKTAADMGHLPQSGPGGMIEVLDSLGPRKIRKVLIHINNTNPILVEDGPERRVLAEHGIEVASDGMTFEL
ncbi:pyrroloquinoline quinone biosynthesis protein PqqB [Paraburkholderia caballeronis]|uniref:Coenzyme PQQ synthesis protein B n=1 Tax=Paraburkholderia caballeronis TaxID=416943 RepID=A0A1H7LMH0_9BURK|nr:pyrroloquinoline quinone biosynthesis protein PqqB [Paraburkholderia caballeronis]PXW28508.1 pyrroloquinoline quinone biosynthesis protein B [Paraburkholderia caballeronis]PXX03874.1 pyrroloquinoline quinone biosynthesis protein B [Paraburkholderia caballeronis]RAK04618.1 pyrroloquinoline quinone biosynthesis protein B [Paraburkholderia caballeronis]SED72552.1 pyrroloquinoline quinone biosynthesis protein B [Paraburkholderia caballeronis]SEK99645.1 pyrroloquinoline quinone biosynthesis prot